MYPDGDQTFDHHLLIDIIFYSQSTSPQSVSREEEVPGVIQPLQEGPLPGGFPLFSFIWFLDIF